MGLKCPVPTPMVHLPVQDPPDSSTPLKRAHHPSPGSINALQGKNYPHYVKPPTKPSTPPWLPSKHPGDTLYGPGIRHIRGIPDTWPGAQGHREGREGPKVTQQTCRATPGVHTCFHLGISTRRSSVPGGAAARGRQPEPRCHEQLPACCCGCYL